jgi:hypothetical protein
MDAMPRCDLSICIDRISGDSISLIIFGRRVNDGVADEIVTAYALGSGSQCMEAMTIEMGNIQSIFSVRIFSFEVKVGSICRPA